MATTKSQVVQARVDPVLKKQATAIFDKVGISTSDAFTLFLRQVVMHRGLPFDAKIPNALTRAALRENVKKSKRYTTVDALFDDVLGANWRNK